MKITKNDKETIALLKTYPSFYKKADVYKTEQDTYSIVLCRQNEGSYCENAEYIGHITRTHNFGLQYARHGTDNCGYDYMTKKDLVTHIQAL